MTNSAPLARTAIEVRGVASKKDETNEEVPRGARAQFPSGVARQEGSAAHTNAALSAPVSAPPLPSWMRLRIYIAGPMRGYRELNFPAFMRADVAFTDLGWDVRNPVRIGQAAFGPNPDAVSPQEFLRADLRELLQCDAMAVLPGWERSVGARAEVAVAVALGFAFYDADTCQPIDAPTSVTCEGYAAVAP